MSDKTEEAKKVKGRGEPARKVGNMRTKDATGHHSTPATKTEQPSQAQSTDASVVEKEPKEGQAIIAPSTELLEEKLAKKYTSKEMEKMYEGHPLPTREHKHGTEPALKKTHGVQQPKPLIYTH